jgi:soluble lytic murein transglycosylase-like protein
MRQGRHRRSLVARAVLAATVLLYAGVAAAGPTGEPEPALRSRLASAFSATGGFDDRYVAEVWLTDMAGRLARYAPKVMTETLQRIGFLRDVHAEAMRAKVSPELVMAVIQVESGFDRYAVSRAGAQGYMQIMPFWLGEIGHDGDNLFHTRTNLRMGCTILRFYLDKEHDSYVRALARYNGSYGKPDYPYLVLHALNQRWSPG